MKKQFQKIVLGLVLVFGLSSCINLKNVHDFSSSSSSSIKKFEDIDYGFKQDCLDKCYQKQIGSLQLNPVVCDCHSNEVADSVTLIIYNAVKGYFDGLASLSNDDLTSYNIDPLSSALKEGQFGSLKIEATHVDAYSKISKTLLKAFTDEYRGKKIKSYVKEANPAIKILIDALDANISKSLYGKLNVAKAELQETYRNLLIEEPLSKYEKRKAIEEYYQRIKIVETKQQQLMIYSKVLRTIADGHQKLADNIDKMSKKELRELLGKYASDVQDIISEFNKLKK